MWVAAFCLHFLNLSLDKLFAACDMVIVGRVGAWPQLREDITMRFTLKNSLDCELDCWNSFEAMIADFQRGELTFNDGDKIEVAEEGLGRKGCARPSHREAVPDDGHQQTAEEDHG
jgi:hypothetical protein